MRGQVIRVIAGFYDIVANNIEYRVRGAGKLRQNEETPCVGDFVEFVPEAFIEKIYERKNSLVRPKVSNVDQVVIVTSLKEPKFSSILLNKLLAVVEFNEIKPILVFTKKDLTDEKPYEDYIKMKYDVFVVNNVTSEGIAEMNNIFTNKLTVFTGQTGAGKSSTISNLANIDLKTQAISKALGRGKHTTRVVEIINWKNGRLIDTPGFSSFELSITKDELAKSYDIFKKYYGKCKFRNCLHLAENDCEIKRQVEKGNIPETRYNDYLRLLKEQTNE